MDTMLSKALREFMTGPLKQLIVNLGGEEGYLVEEELKKFNRKEPCWLSPATNAMSAKPAPELLLEPVGIVRVSATTKKFRAGANFLLKHDGGICSYFGSNFNSWFLEGDGKTEEPIGEQILCYGKLRKSSVDTPIIAELGGEAKAETTLTEMFSLMEKQKKGKAGVLLNNGYANIFYIRDQSGVLRTVYVDWRVDGWNVRANEVSNPLACFDGGQVFSRKPSET
ncbi:MAG: hypothetical protein AAB350_03380 [Patescibacteria group bacterium]